MKLQTFMALANSHKIDLIEGGRAAGIDWKGDREAEPMPGYWIAECICGWWTRSYHGEQLAREASQRHLFAMLHEIEMTPGGANVRKK